MEGIRSLNRNSFRFGIDDTGHTYVEMAYNEIEKKKQGDERNIKEKQARMYAEDGDDCPVRSLKLLLEKLHPDCDALFQYPKATVRKSDNVWFNRQPIGKNSICNFMKRISEAAGLSRPYTNHCIRATSITEMNAAGVENTNIIAVTGHRSVDSLKPYLSGPTDLQKRDISRKLHIAKRPHQASDIPKTFVPASHSQHATMHFDPSAHQVQSYTSTITENATTASSNSTHSQHLVSTSKPESSYRPAISTSTEQAMMPQAPCATPCPSQVPCMSSSNETSLRTTCII